MKRFLPYLITALVALLVWWWANVFFQNYAKVEIRRENIYRNQALRDPFFAANLFLNTMGMDSQSQPLLGSFPDSDTLLVLGTPYDGIDPFLSEDLADWVDGGGKVLLMPRPATYDTDVYVFEDALLGELGVEIINHDPNPGFFDQQEDEDEEKSEEDEETETPEDFIFPWVKQRQVLERDLRLEEKPGMRTYQVELSAQYQLQDPWAIAINQGDTHFMRLHFGHGQVVAFSQLDFLHSRHLGNLDHGIFLWDLSQYLGVKKVRFVYLKQAPSIWNELFRHAWMAWLPLLLLLLVWLWAATRHFGPALADPPLARRSLMEHIEACGWYLWRGKRQQDLVGACRSALLRRMEFRRPGWSKTDHAQMVRRLARVSGLSQEAVRLALDEETPRQPGAFTEIIKNLELMRRNL